MPTFIPKNDAEFDLYYRNFCQIVTARTSGASPVWTHIPQARVTELTGGCAAWFAAYGAYLADKTSVLRAAKNDAKKAGTKILQDFTSEFIRYSRAVSNDDKRLLGVHVPSGTWTSVKPPDTAPGVELIQMGPGLLGVIFRHLGGRKGSRPPGVTGARAYYGVFDTPPTDQTQLPGSVWISRCPTIVRFRESDRGKRVYFALRWEIEKGGEKNEGPWSEIISEIIP